MFYSSRLSVRCTMFPVLNRREGGAARVCRWSMPRRCLRAPPSASHPRAAPLRDAPRLPRLRIYLNICVRPACSSEPRSASEHARLSDSHARAARLATHCICASYSCASTPGQMQPGDHQLCSRCIINSPQPSMIPPRRLSYVSMQAGVYLYR